MSADTKFILDIDLLEIGDLQKFGLLKRPLLRHPHLPVSCDLNQVVALCCWRSLWPSIFGSVDTTREVFSPVGHQFHHQVQGYQVTTKWMPGITRNVNTPYEGKGTRCFQNKKLPRVIMPINKKVHGSLRYLYVFLCLVQ